MIEGMIIIGIIQMIREKKTRRALVILLYIVGMTAIKIYKIGLEYIGILIIILYVGGIAILLIFMMMMIEN